MTMASHHDSLRDFDRVRRKAFIQSALGLVTRQSFDLIPFETARRQLRLRNPHYRGLQEISLDQIVGSVGRYLDFTRAFFPRSGKLRERWASVEDKVKAGGLPPIQLYQVGGAYFVRDGNHRVSVARAQNAPAIEAYVWEYPSLVPLDPKDNLDTLLIKQGYVEFLEATRLDKLRPEQDIQLTAPGRYWDLQAHINAHAHFLGQERGCEISREEAVTSWYDNAYQPIIRAIERAGILKQFPKRTEADLYIWISRWQLELSQRYDDSVDPDAAVADFIKRKAPKG
ncbi:MAG TPA: hypothetical protein G4N96_13860 [Chloroflexi bacterium]|nr:hypothetical protein [Chloroflexota bacterium]